MMHTLPRPHAADHARELAELAEELREECGRAVERVQALASDPADHRRAIAAAQLGFVSDVLERLRREIAA